MNVYAPVLGLDFVLILRPAAAETASWQCSLINIYV